MSPTSLGPDYIQIGSEKCFVERLAYTRMFSVIHVGGGLQAAWWAWEGEMPLSLFDPKVLSADTREELIVKMEARCSAPS